MAQLNIELDYPPVRARATPQRQFDQPRPRGLVGQVALLIFRPCAFFQTLPLNSGSAQWMLVALLILAIVGFTAVRQAALANADIGASMTPDMGLVGPAPMDPGIGPIGPGPVPPDVGIPPEGPGVPAPQMDITATWTTALRSAGGLVLVWLIQSILLSEVSLFNGRRPRFGLNLQIAVFASVPLALMSSLQLLYYSGGGRIGEPGLSGLVSEWQGFASLSPMAEALVLSFAAQATVFWLWSLILLYIGARHALRGRSWASLLVALVWVAVAVAVPVIANPASAASEETPPVESVMPQGVGEIMPEISGEMPLEEAAPINDAPEPEVQVEPRRR